MDATDIANDLEHVLHTDADVQARLVELGAQIDADYAGRELLLVGVLNGAVMVMADRTALTRVVTNLVANARRHTPAGTDVGVTVDVRDGGVVVRVEDNGPGLPEAVAASPGKRFGNRDRTSATSSAPSTR